jgi:acetyl esterase/lipase
VQSLLKFSQIGADRRMRRAGLTIETRRVGPRGSRVGLRILRPAGAVRGVVLDIHGGGWVIGNARMDDALNLGLIRAAGVMTVSVEYRLAGRRAIPALMAECLTAARWLLAGGLPEACEAPVILVGESAGAHLAAATLLQLQAEPALLARIAGAVLYYGVFDLAGTPSVRAAGPDTLVLHGPGMLPGMQRLTPGLDDAGRRTPPLSPLYGDLAGMPPALMFAATLDPLQEDTLAMAERWRAAADVELHVLPDSPHGFIRFDTAIARKTLARTQAWVNARLAAGASAASQA